MRMATRFMYQALATAALCIALSPLLAATTAPGPSPSNTAEATQLDLPTEPSNCRARARRFWDRKIGYYTRATVAWRDNSGNEDGFIAEVWMQNLSGAWVLSGAQTTAANSTEVEFYFEGRNMPDMRFRVKAFNVAGDSAWSNWTH
jgi:hypothetical protein